MKPGYWVLLMVAIVATAVGVIFGLYWALGTAVVGIVIGAVALATMPGDQKAAWAGRLNRSVRTTANLSVGGWLRHHWLLALALAACVVMAVVDWRVGLSVALIVLLLKFLLARSGLRKGLVVATVVIGGIIAAIEWREHVKYGVGATLDTAAEPWDGTKKAVSDTAKAINLPEFPVPATRGFVRDEVGKQIDDKVVPRLVAIEGKLGGTTPPASSTPPTGTPPAPPSPTGPSATSVSLDELRRDILSRPRIKAILAKSGMSMDQLDELAGSVEGGADDQFAVKGASKSLESFAAFLVEAGDPQSLVSNAPFKDWIALRQLVKYKLPTDLPAKGTVKSGAEILKTAGIKEDAYKVNQRHLDDFLADLAKK